MVCYQIYFKKHIQLFKIYIKIKRFQIQLNQIHLLNRLLTVIHFQVTFIQA